MSNNAAVLHAISESNKALKDGNRRAARRWAEQAVFLARDEEEPWLALAQTSSPSARVAYIQEALKINPNSLLARAAMQSAHQGLNIQSNLYIPPINQMEVWVNTSEEDVQLRRSHNLRGRRLWVSVTSILALIACVAMGWLSWSGSFRNIYVLVPPNRTTQTITKGGKINTPLPARSLLATLTMTPLPPATAAPSLTPIQTFTFTPDPTNTSSPTPVPTRLPALPATYTPSPTSAPPAPVPVAGKSILVDISDQHVFAYEGGKVVFSFVASTGRNNSTQEGHYRILDKSPNAYSDPWGFWMPYWMGIYYVGYNLENGFHSLPVLSNGAQLWGSQIGSPITFGCVVLRPNDMKKLYQWTGIGTTVVIRR